MKFKKIFMGLSLLASVLFSSACSIFGGSDTGVMIDRVESSTNEEGTTIVTMYFTDEDLEPLTFEIPRGEVGEVGPIGAAGVGIENITSRPSDDGKSTILTISFTSEEMPDKEFTVPNGVSIVSTNSSYDPEDNTTIITFTLSDGTVIPRDGEDEIKIVNGKDGVGIESVTQTEDENKNIIITITYTDETMGDNGQTVVTIPYKNGEDGNGISYITGTQVGLQYYITVHYTDPNKEPEELAPITIPRANKWFSDRGAPGDFYENQSETGDYYFDLENYIIYYFDGTSYVELINLTENNQISEECTVTFNPNGGRFEKPAITGKITVNKGELISLARIPTCVKDGFTFEGYYTTPEGPANPLSGRLTDLTPIYSDIEFFAYYEAI